MAFQLLLHKRNKTFTNYILLDIYYQSLFQWLTMSYSILCVISCTPRLNIKRQGEKRHVLSCGWSFYMWVRKSCNVTCLLRSKFESNRFNITIYYYMSDKIKEINKQSIFISFPFAKLKHKLGSGFSYKFKLNT